MSNSPTDREHWSRVAREWIEWARLPGHDAFWAYRESLVNFFGPGGGEALDLGCGEGRVSRVMKGLGYRVTASDPVAELVKAAIEVDSAHDYAVADATALPLTDSRFEGTEERNGLQMHFAGSSQPLEAYASALEGAGLAITSLREPIPDHLHGHDYLTRWTRVPLFLWLKARRL